MNRPLYPMTQCQRVENSYPETCIGCGQSLDGEDRPPYRIQTVEIPPVVAQVREHRFHPLECQQCGCGTCAWDAEIINGNGDGERVVAPVGVLR